MVEEFDEHDLIDSPLSRMHTVNGQTVEVRIYRLPNTGWTLEVVDEFNNSTLWDGEFDSDQAALDEFLHDLAEEGIGAFVGRPDGASLH